MLEPIEDAVQPSPRVLEGAVISAALGGASHSRDDRATVLAGPGTLEADARILVSRVAAYAPPPPSRHLVGGVYDFAAADASSGAGITTFPRPVTISFTYRLEELNGTPESSLAIYHFDERDALWEPVPSTLDRRTRVVTARVSHFSQYSLQGKHVSPDEPVFGSPANHGFETLGYTLIGGPDNAGFEAAPYTLEARPTNADFETGDSTGWTSNGTILVQTPGHDGSYYARVAGSTIYIESSLFTIPMDAQSIHFWADVESTRTASTVALYDSSGGLLNGSARSFGGSTGWYERSFNVATWRGQQVRVRFTNNSGLGTKIDDVTLVRDVPSWETTSDRVSIAAGSGRTYVRLVGSGTFVESSLFTIPSDTQSIHFWAQVESTLYASSVALLDSADQQLASRSVSGTSWSEKSFNVASWRGQQVKLRFTNNSGAGTNIDDVTLVRDVPSWNTTSDGPFITTSVSRPSPHVKLVASGRHVESALFTVPSDAEKLRFWAQVESTLYASTLQLLDAGGTQLASQNFSGTSWSQKSFNLASWRGQQVRVRFTNNSGLGTSVDDVVVDSFGNMLGGCPNRAACGDPVNMTTGNWSFDAEDLSIPGRGLGLSLTRSYNSMAGTSGPFGRGWTFNYAMSLAANADSSVVLTYPDGRRVTYTPAGGGSYTRPLEVYDDLAWHSGSQSYTLTTKSQTVFTFTSAGKLTSIADPNGNTLSLSYDQGLLATVTDPSGLRSLAFSYDAAGRVEEVSAPLDTTVRYGYDAAGDLTAVTDPMGGVTLYEYGPYGLVRGIDQNGHVFVDQGHDVRGRVVEQVDPWDNVTSYSYDGAGRTSTITDPLGNAQSFGYDLYGRTVWATDALGYTEQYGYDAAGNRDQVTDRNGGITRYQYDSMGNVTWVTDPLGGVEAYSYDARSNPLSRTDALGRTTGFAYDGVGNLTRITDALSGEGVMAYDGHGQLISSADPLSNVTQYGYDTNGNQTAITDPLGGTTLREFDLLGRMLWEKDPLEHTTSFQYRADGRLTSVTNALSRTTGYGYDLVGNRTAVTDANGRTTHYGYDELNRLTYVTDAAGQVTRYGYDAAGNRTAVTDALDKTTLYQYDPTGRLSSETDSGNHTWEYDYDNTGNVLTRTDANQAATSYAYDAAGRMTRVTYPAQVDSVQVAYDLAGSPTSVVSDAGSTTYAYDELGRVTWVTGPATGSSVGYEYDAAGRRTRLTYPDGKTADYGYDEAGRLSWVTDWLGKVSGYSYDDAGRLVSTSYPTGVVETRSYDDANGLTGIVATKDQTTLGSFTYTLNDAGIRTAVQTAEGTESYGYDEVYRLTWVTYPDSSAQTYSYDAVGNRLVKTQGGTPTSYSYDDAHRMTAAGGVSYGYDSNGNQTSRGNDAFSWDHENRMTGATVGGASATYTYRPDGLRHSKTVGMDTTTYVWDTNRSIPVVLQDGTHTYVYGLGLISQTDGSGNQSYFLANGLGSTSMLTDEYGDVVASYTYDVFGALRSSSGSGSTEYLFTGEQDDTLVGYTYLRARYYDPATARFISKDPFAGIVTDPATLNRYAYAHNNPATLTDPSGHFAIAVPAAVYGYLAIASAAAAFQVWWMMPDNQVREEVTQCIMDLTASQDLSVFFAKGREKGEVKWYKRGMTSDQAERFKREVEKEKESAGRGGRDNLPPEKLEEIRDDILEGRR